MAGIFDGMASLGADVFGAEVAFLPAGGARIDVMSIFRLTPVEVADGEGGAVLIETPSWRVSREALSPMPRTGDRIDPGDGHIYAIVSKHSSGSPARDAFVIYALERLL